MNMKSKRNIAIIGIVGIALILMAIYKLFIVRTVDSINGWKHQIGNFGECGDCIANSLAHVNKEIGNANHRVITPWGLKMTFCDSCWQEYENYFNDMASNQDDNSNDEASNAKVCAVMIVKNSLKSPSTADFCSYTEMTATSLEGRKWKVSGYVDAENSLGAVVRENWTVTLALTDSGCEDYSVTFSDSG